MASDNPRADEQAALDAIRAVIDIDDCEWMPETHEQKTPDLRLQLADGRIVFLEITLSADQVAKSLKGAAGSKKPFRFGTLAWDWTVWVSDRDPQGRQKLGRRLRDFVNAMAPVLARVEATNGSTDQMAQRATEMFDVKAFHPHRDFPNAPRRRWLHESAPGTDFEDWGLHDRLPTCGYWYVPDLEDSVLHNLEPRRAVVVGTPSPAIGEHGSNEIHVSPLEGAFSFASADFLIPAIERAVANKQKKNQMAGYRGEHWLAVAVEGNAAQQLEEACAPERPATVPDLSGVAFDGYDELWVIACTFHDWQFAVARFTDAGQHPALCTIPRPPRIEAAE